MVSKGTQDLLVNLGIVVLVIVVIYVVIIRNPNALNWLKGLGSKTGAAKVGAIAIGESVPGPNVYPVVGPALTSGIITIRSSGTSFRDNQGFDCGTCNRESTWFFNPGGSGDVSIKMGAHGDESDATSLIQYSTDGQKWRCEGPHMTYNDLSGSGTVDVGSGNIGIKGISWNVSGGTNHHEIWISTDDGANWTKVAEYEGGADGCTEMACPVPDAGGGCQDTLRIDDPSGHGFFRRSIVEITPTDTPVGGGEPPPETPTNEEEEGAAGSGNGGGDGTTPPPEEEEEEPEEEEEEEEDEEDNGGGGEQTCSNGRCTCANGAFFQLVGGQTCADCTGFCANANQAKVVARAAKETMRDVMYQSFDGRRHRYNRYLPRQNGYGFAFASKRHLRLGNLR